MQRSYESHLDRHGVLWNATYPWCLYPESPIYSPSTPDTLLTSAHPNTSRVKFALRCNVAGGEEEKCRWFLVLSPSVWDFQTNFEPWSFWSFFCLFLFLFNFYLQSQSPYSIPHLCPAPPPSLSPTTYPPITTLTTNPTPLCVLYSMTGCPSVTVCLPVSLCLCSCLLFWCLSPFLSASCLVSGSYTSCLVFLSLSQLFWLFQLFFVTLTSALLSPETFFASQQTFDTTYK